MDLEQAGHDGLPGDGVDGALLRHQHAGSLGPAASFTIESVALCAAKLQPEGCQCHTSDDRGSQWTCGFACHVVAQSKSDFLDNCVFAIDWCL